MEPSKEKRFNLAFNIFLVVGMIVAVTITTVFKLQQPQAKTFLLLLAAFGSVMGVINTVLSANGHILTFVFGFLDVLAATVVCYENGIMDFLVRADRCGVLLHRLPGQRDHGDLCLACVLFPAYAVHRFLAMAQTRRFCRAGKRRGYQGQGETPYFQAVDLGDSRCAGGYHYSLWNPLLCGFG